MARAKHVGRRPAKINPLNEDPAGAGEARPLDPPPGPHAVSLTAGSLTYTQNFDALASSGATGTSLPADWAFNETGGAAPATYSVGTGSGTTGDTWSFGIAGTNPVTDRALGSLASTTVTQILLGAGFANMSGATITAILISYVGEQWRRGGNTVPDRLDFQISFNATSLTTGTWTDVNGLDFASINASASPLTLDGNAAANRLAISFSVAGVSVANGGTFWIRWIDTNIAGNDDGLAIDNFSLTATVNRPPILATTIPDHHCSEDEAILYTIPAGSFSDPDGNPLTYTASRADNAPLPSWLAFTAATRSFSGTPPADFNGTLSIKVTASDGSFSVSDIFDLVIDPVNDAAIIGGTDSGAVAEDGSLTASGQLTISDVDAGETIFQPVAAGTTGANGHGMFEMLADGRWTYTLDNDDPDIQALNAVDSLADALIVLTADGTTHILNVTIHGANEASAAPYVRLGDEALVNSSVAGLQSQPSVAFLADGRYVVVFQVFDGDQLDVHGRLFNRDGAPAAPDFSVNIAAGGEQHLPQIAALSDGGFVVVWQDSAGGSYDIVGRLYAADGSAGGEIPIIAALANETAPAVAGLPGGGFVALWVDDGNSDGDVRARIFLADGSPAGDAFAVNAPAPGGQVHAAVAVLAGGTIVAVWEDGAAGDVRMRLFSAAGTPLTAELTANGGLAGSQGAPCVVALAGGGYAIAWLDGGADGDGYGIYARLFEADGDPAGAEFRVNTLAAGDQTSPSIAALPDGGFIVSWADGAGPDADDIRAQRFDADGVPIDAELVVNGHADGVQSQPAMAGNKFGTLVVAWNNSGSPGVGGDDDGAVVHALLTPGGAPPAGPTAAIIGGEDRGAVTEDTAPGTTGTLTITDPDAGEARLVAQADAAGSNGYGLFQIHADGIWTYAIAGLALADTIPGGETRSDSIIVSAIDGTTHAVTVTITGTNDAPAATISGDLTATEQTALDLKGNMSVADVDAGAGSVTIMLAVGHGLLHLAAGGSGASIFGNDSRSVTITGTIAQINALLGSDATSVVTYTATGDAPPATTTLTLSIDDDAVAGALTGSDSATIVIAAVNDAPVNGVPGAQGVDEDAPLVFSTANGNALSVADVDAIMLTVTLSVAHGTLMLAGTIGLTFADGDGDATMTFSGTAAAINAALGAGLTYAPAADYDGGDTLALAVSDEGMLSDVDTIAIAIAPINDAPAGASVAFTLDEDMTFTFNPSHFGFTDAAEGDDFLGVVIATIPLGGTILLDAIAVAAGMFVSAADIALGRLTFVPAPDAYGAPYGSFTFQVRDDGGTGNGGQDTDQSPDMISFEVAARNDAPAIAVPGPQTIDEDGALILTGDSLIGVADIDATMLTVTLGAVHGLLTLNGTLGLSFSDGDGTNDATMTFSGTAGAINAALDGLTYHADADRDGTDAIGIQVTDGGETGAGPVGTDSATIGITINPVNDAPSGTSATIALDEDGARILTEADFGFSDPAEGDGFAGVAIATLPSGGMLRLNGEALLVAGTFVTAAQLAAGQLVFQPDADANGAAYAILTFQVRDDGGTGNGGQDSDQSPNRLTFDVNSVNDVPSGTDKTATGGEDDPYVFAAADFGFSDPVEGNGFLAVLIATLPLDGDILLNGVAVAAGDVVAVSAIDAGMLTFRPEPDRFASAYAAFTFKVQDDGGTLNGGVDTDPLANVMTIDVAPANDPPVAADDRLAATEDVPVTYAAAQILGNDSDVEGDARRIASISGATGGTAALNGDGSVTFTPAPDFNGVAGFDYVVSDGNGGTATAHVTIDVAALDDAPTAQPDAFTVTESGTIVAGNLFANDSDVDGPPLAIASVSGGPGANVGTQFTLASGALLTVYANGTFDYDPNGVFLRTPTAGSGASNTPSQDSFSYTLAGSVTPVTVLITLTGLDTDDTLRGTAGADVLMGGNGNDWYFIENGTDQVVEGVGQGNDRVFASVSYTLTAGAEVELLTTDNHAGTAAIDLTGNAFANTIFGNDGDNKLNGGAGADTLVGRLGNDWFFIDNAGDQVVETAGQGNDRLFSSVSYTLAAGVEVELMTTDFHTGTAAIDLSGNERAQAIFGNEGANRLGGGGGADSLVGFGGDDWYFITSGGEAVFEAAGGGNDRIFAGVDYRLQAGAEVELITTDFHAGTAAIDIGGNEFSQAVFGNAGGNILDGGAGKDVLVGNGGADIFLFSTALNTAAGTAFASLAATANVDRIHGFASDDRIGLDAARFGLKPGGLAAGAFVLGTAAQDADDRIIYDSATGALLFDADGSGAGAAQLFAYVDGPFSLDATSFAVL